MQSCADTVWNMSIIGRGGFLSHLSKSRCIRKLESCVRFILFRGVCPVVELTGLGLLCLCKGGRVPRMCVWAMESGEKSGNF